MAFLAPLAFLGLSIAIPILLLYMLRLRRREVVVSSTYLWQQIVQDNEANTPWQRLRRNLLLILQLIILALMVLALARPFITVQSVSSGQTALLLDASASMRAIDISDGAATRFSEAQRQALDVVNSMSAGQVMTVIRVGAAPEVLAPYTADRDQLRAAITAAQPGSGAADWLGALTLAAAGGAGADDFTLLIISDGGIDPLLDFSSLTLPGEVRFIQVGERSDNVALTALATRALPGQPPQLFGQITNYGDAEAEVILNLRVDGAAVPVASSRYVVPPRSDLPIVSTSALSMDFRTLQADLTVSVNSQGRDYLDLDNTAWAVARGSSERRVLLLTEGNLFLEQGLRSMPGVELIRGQIDRPLPTQPFDLYVFDGVLPAALPAGDILVLNPPRSTPLFTVGGLTEATANLRAASDDPLLTFVDFRNVNVLNFRQVVAVGGWARTLIEADGGPLLLAGDVQGRQVAVLTFDIRNSDLPLNIAWPVLLANLLEWFTPGQVLVNTGSLNVGDTVIARPPLEADRVRLVRPDGETRDQEVIRDTLIFTDTDAPGLYTLEVYQDETLIRSQVFAVNLFNAVESDIAPRALTLGGVELSGEMADEPGQFEFWPLVALLALAMLLVEWYAYHQRSRIPTLLRRRPA